jgi:hypothetical protein
MTAGLAWRSDVGAGKKTITHADGFSMEWEE